MGLPPEWGLDPIQGSACSQRQAVRQAGRQAREQATRQARQSTSQRVDEWEGCEEQTRNGGQAGVASSPSSGYEGKEACCMRHMMCDARISWVTPALPVICFYMGIREGW